MPRVSKQLAAENRKKIENITSHLIRDRGFAVSVSDLMHAAGLTHGGFYKHFQSKDELIDIACKDTFEQSVRKWQNIVDTSEDDRGALKTIFNRYLSEQNLENPGTSCPLSTLSIDVAREPREKPVKRSFQDGVEALLKILSELDAGEAQQGFSKNALVQLSLLSGALTLARSVDHDLAVKILESVREFLQEN
ncbi:TetR/AcrR family transcriptional regulator [Acinetobacter gerneri]|jgi:TetR/AcrR family transcriptional repressor of nem operon|uniref:TetR/AcrR family transcriptional regulator n=1 Tax=Acinetobacter gerneri TaxID=202952 RepID=UPI0023F089D0|nr:TetR/AcrR family transcriptional regulator [Acinetobacter gerneri]MCH4245890.1 TetR/AcrR family transcriptional regulator [Acinetobacter gerneri]